MNVFPLKYISVINLTQTERWIFVGQEVNLHVYYSDDITLNLTLQD